MAEEKINRRTEANEVERQVLKTMNWLNIRSIKPAAVAVKQRTRRCHYWWKQEQRGRGGGSWKTL